MIVETASKIKLFLVKSQKPKREPKAGLSSSLTSKANVEKELAKHDLEAQALITQILDMFEDG